MVTCLLHVCCIRLHLSFSAHTRQSVCHVRITVQFGPFPTPPDVTPNYPLPPLHATCTGPMHLPHQRFRSRRRTASRAVRALPPSRPREGSPPTRSLPASWRADADACHRSRAMTEPCTVQGHAALTFVHGSIELHWSHCWAPFRPLDQNCRYQIAPLLHLFSRVHQSESISVPLY